MQHAFANTLKSFRTPSGKSGNYYSLPALAQQFNMTFGRDMDGIKDFLVLHYHATQGRDDPLWQHTRAMTLPDTLLEREDQYRRSGRLMLDGEELFREASWLAVLNGQEIFAAGYSPLADTLDSGLNRQQLDQIAQVIARAVPTLPKHDDAIAALIGQKVGQSAFAALK